MMKKCEVLKKLADMQDEESFNQGETFYTDLKNVMDKHRNYFSGHFFFDELEKMVASIKRLLLKEDWGEN